MIELGDKVRDKITGYIGTAVARVEFINGCVQYEVAGQVGKDNKVPEPISIDEQSLVVIGKKKKEVMVSETGGRSTPSMQMRGF